MNHAACFNILRVSHLQVISVKCLSKICTLLTLVLLMFSRFCDLPASAESMGGENLAGAPKFRILVEQPPPELQRLGFTAEWIKNQAELKLRVARLPVVANNDLLPSLYVNVNGILHDNGTLVYNVRLQFDEQVTITRSQRNYTAATWESAGIGFLGADRVSGFGSKIGQLVDDFILDYLRANPTR
jgi:hypothetical protein